MTSLEADCAALGFGGYIINTQIQSVSWWHVLSSNTGKDYGELPLLYIN